MRLLAAGRDADRGQHYLALEWLEDDLVGHLRQQHSDAMMWAAFARRVARPLLQGLGAAHARHVLHRDIKPSNVMVAGDGTVKLTDFGVAKLLDSIRYGMTVAELHSKPFAAPEREDNAADARSDLYSLGVTMIDLLCGLDTRLPKDADPRTVLERVDVPDDVRHFLGSLIEPNPDKRPFSAKIALSELDRVLVWHPETPPRRRPQLMVALTQAVVKQARGLLAASTDEQARRLLIADICDEHEPPSLVRDRRCDAGWEQETAVGLDLVGRELLFSARFAREGDGTLVLTGVRVVPQGVLERRREDGIELEHRLFFGGRLSAQREDADVLIDALAAQDAARAAAAAERSEAALLGRWRSVLDAKTELEARREDPLPFTTSNGILASQAVQLQLRTPSAINRSFARSSLKFNGRLLTAGLPISGATLDVLQRIAGTSTLRIIKHLNTATDGTFTVNIPRGPSRLIEVAYKVHPTDLIYAAVAKVNESTAASVHLNITPRRTSTNGTITLRGTVKGPIPAHGTLINILVHYRGRWVPIPTTTPRTDKHGHFSMNTNSSVPPATSHSLQKSHPGKPDPLHNRTQPTHKSHHKVGRKWR